jgi:hypothetical protein
VFDRVRLDSSDAKKFAEHYIWFMMRAVTMRCTATASALATFNSLLFIFTFWLRSTTAAPDCG